MFKALKFSKTREDYQEKKVKIEQSCKCHTRKAKEFRFHSETMRSHQRVLRREVQQEVGEHT